MAQVELKNICKSYDGKSMVVDNVNINVNDKEFVVLVGPSGCGKSTTLRMIAGLEEITKGEIFIDGKLVNEIPPKDRDIAMVFQNYALYPHMTVFDNMAFGLKLRKYSKEEIKDRVEEAANILGLEELLNRKPKELSGGQKQRVAVGRAIVRKPKVFLFDEPLSNLDAKLRVQMRTEISKLHKKLEATMIYVTHDQTEAMTMGDKIVVMKDGFVNQIDSPISLYNKPINKFVAGFIGSPAMNFIEGEIKNSGKLSFNSEKGDIIFDLNEKIKSKLKEINPGKSLIGIRPEDFSIGTDDAFDTIKIEVDIELAEPLGNETYVYFRIDNKQIIARINIDKELKIGSKIELLVNQNKIHFFDGKTNQSLV
ncbi:MAG: sn-glycerol-3-phosphate ABC transporter ATP-binding protein UgpC [Melioribacteraceae bacterium]|nr:sn-glycerol-3-phosphate ABC transporter ATP-binding protein UgpC [Melioribacteraceae bacterium]